MIKTPETGFIFSRNVHFHGIQDNIQKKIVLFTCTTECCRGYSGAWSTRGHVHCFTEIKT